MGWNKRRYAHANDLLVEKKRARNDDDDDVENQQFSSSNGTYTHVNGKEKEEISVMGGKKRRFANGEVVVGWWGGDAI